VGIADRDWYREPDEDRRPVIALRVRRSNWLRWASPVAIVAVLLAGVAYQEFHITPAAPPAAQLARTTQVEPRPRLPPPTADAVVFPKDGFTMVSRRPGSDWDSPLTLRMPTDTPPYRHWIVSVRNWATGKWVATVYLSNGVITTVFLPSGFYRIAMAAGVNWQGEARLFGAGTSAWEWTSAVSVAPKVKPVIGSPTDATENAVPLASDAFRTR
jgi:hypothetical protein